MQADTPASQRITVWAPDKLRSYKKIHGRSIDGPGHVRFMKTSSELDRTCCSPAALSPVGRDPVYLWECS